MIPVITAGPRCEAQALLRFTVEVPAVSKDAGGHRRERG
jgi:hypothetical protein